MSQKFALRLMESAYDPYIITHPFIFSHLPDFLSPLVSTIVQLLSGRFFRTNSKSVLRLAKEASWVE
jgi:hypothetical protein